MIDGHWDERGDPKRAAAKTKKSASKKRKKRKGVKWEEIMGSDDDDDENHNQESECKFYGRKTESRFSREELRWTFYNHHYYC